jgi:phenylalanyl-tRNA synthetase beta chain
VNIGNTVEALKRAALLIKEIAGGKISSDIIDVYPVPKPKKEISLSYQYLKKLSGKNYHPDTIRDILTSLNFTILREAIDHISVAVPFSNPDISIPADVVEEIMRIDGLDNIEIPEYISMAPAIDTDLKNTLIKEKITGWLTGNGFDEIFTNSITNSKYFDTKTLTCTVKIINSLSEGLNVMRPDMLPTGLECIAYNLNRKNNDLLFFEFGKTYSVVENKYFENKNLTLYFTGNKNQLNWNLPAKKVDIFYVKGVCEAIFSLAGLSNYEIDEAAATSFDECLIAAVNRNAVAVAGKVLKKDLEMFSIKQPVYTLYIDWEKLISFTNNKEIIYQSVSKFPQVQRDLSILVDKKIAYSEIENLVKSLQIKRLKKIQLFDVFENEKLGENKKSFAINFTFLDKEKTMTDDEVELMMDKIITNLENKLNAVIRRNA